MTGRREEAAAKLSSVRAWLARTERDAVLIDSQAGFAWITAGGDNHVSVDSPTGSGAVLVTGDEAFLLCKNIERPRLTEEEVAGLGLTVEDYPWYEPGAGAALVARLCDVARALSELGGMGLAPAPPSLVRLRYTLVPPEIERYRRLGADAALAVEVACLATRPGDTELDVAARVADECERRNILPLVDLVGADERIDRYRHPVPTTHRVGRTVLVALTGRRHGLFASLTRMMTFGPPDAERAARHLAAARVDAREILASRPGVTLAQVFAAGVDQYDAEGYGGQWRLHHQGGLTGYAGREIFADPTADHVLDASQVVAWNPSITGAKSEDTVLVTAGGHEVLTRTPTWPQRGVEVAGGAVDRPAIVVRDD